MFSYTIGCNSGNLTSCSIFSNTNSIDSWVALCFPGIHATTLAQTGTTNDWIAMQFCTDVHGDQLKNPNNFGDPHTFLLALQ